MVDTKVSTIIFSLDDEGGGSCFMFRIPFR